MTTPERRAEDLKARQRPVKDRYREAPESAVITMRASGELGAESISCGVDTGRAMVQAGLHPAAAGGAGMACSGDMLLEALVACAGVTLRRPRSTNRRPAGPSSRTPTGGRSDSLRNAPADRSRVSRMPRTAMMAPCVS